MKVQSHAVNQYACHPKIFQLNPKFFLFNASQFINSPCHSLVTRWEQEKQHDERHTFQRCQIRCCEKAAELVVGATNS